MSALYDNLTTPGEMAGDPINGIAIYASFSTGDTPTELNQVKLVFTT